MPDLIDVPEGTPCPLCPSHQDDEFVYSSILKGAICRGCSWEILNLITDKERPYDPLLARPEEVTGLSYSEYQILERISWVDF